MQFDDLTEEQGPFELKLTGEIPVWAAGSLYRTGPGGYKIDDTARGTFYTSHWFDGFAQTHRFDIVPQDDGTSVTVHYSSRRQSDQLIDKIKRDGVRVNFSFAQRADPCVGIFSKVTSTFSALASHSSADRTTENVCVTVLSHLNLPDSVQKPITRPVMDAAAVRKAESKAPDVKISGHRAEKLPRSMWIGTDTPTLKNIDPRTLEPIGYTTQRLLHPELAGPLSCAHAQRDPVTGDLFNYNLQFGRYAIYRIFRLNASTGTVDILATISRPDVNAAYIHSFFLTPSFVVLCIPSTHMGNMGFSVLWQRNMVDAIVPFSEDNKCKWLVVDRLHGKGVVAEFETDAGFFFHSVNAFEEPVAAADGTGSGALTVSCDVVDFPNHDIIFALYYDVMLQRNGAADAFFDEAHARGQGARLARYRFTVPAVEAEDESRRLAVEKVFAIPAPHAGELPTINPAFAARRHRYVYALSNRGLSTLLDGIVKTDTETREALLWDPPHGHTPGEAIFVGRPGSTEEDDGVLLSVVLDGHARTSYLLCLDARTMNEVGRAEVGIAVGIGFHGHHHGVST